MKAENNKSIYSFFTTDQKKLMQGGARIVGSAISFSKEFLRARADYDLLKSLINYLGLYESRGQGCAVIGKSRGEFMLYSHLNGLALYLHEEGSWNPSEAIYVIDLKKVSTQALDDVVRSMEEDSSIMGRVIDKDYHSTPACAIVRTFSKM